MNSFEDKISLMIPAYLNGDLSEAECAKIETYAAQNPSIAADIEFQRNLKGALAPDEDSFEPGELGWARLSKAIKQEEALKEHSVNPKPQFWRYATAILAVAAIGQAGVLGSMALKDDEIAQYKTVSETPVQAYTAKLGFNPNVIESQLTQTLLSLEADIVSGPSSIGLYEVQFKTETSCLTAFEEMQTKNNIVDTFSMCE